MKSYEVVRITNTGRETVIATYTSKQVALARAKELQASCHEKSIKYIVKEKQ
nr:MAG TPA: hypothetical protein [Caudoviricetes sp.]